MSNGIPKEGEAPALGESGAPPPGSTPRATHSLPPVSRGRVFGKFRLLASLGAGGMGEVFLAMTRGGLGVRKLNVIKRLRHFAEDDQREHAQQMFLNEARLATLLNHPNVVQTYDVGVEDGRMFLVMEYLEGQSLHALFKHAGEHRIDDRILIKMVSDALCGLHYAHELSGYDGKPLNIVHRDLSPHNIIVTYEGVAKIVDFGIAKTSVSTKTELGVIKGKFAYMAPEQAGEDRVDRRADVFVMGIVLWELLTGRRLVARRNDLQTITRLLHDEFEPVSSVRPDICPQLDVIVAKALQKNIDDRFASALEMREALENVLNSSFRPVRQEEVGKCVTDLFKDDRAAIQQRIHDCVSAALEDPDPDQLPSLRGPLEPTPSGNRREHMSTSGSNKFYISQSTHDDAAPMVTGTTAALANTPVKKNRKQIAVVVGAMVVAGVLAFAGMRGRDEHDGTARAAKSDLNAKAAVESAEAEKAPVAPAAPLADKEPAPPSVAVQEPQAAAPAPAEPARVEETAEPPAAQEALPTRDHSGKRKARRDAASANATNSAQGKESPAAPHQRVFNTEL